MSRVVSAGRELFDVPGASPEVLARVLAIGLEGRIDADTQTRGELDAKITVWLTSETAPERFAQLAQLCVDVEAYALVGFDGYAELR